MINKEKKKQLVNDFELWWNHQLKRPIIQVNLVKKEKIPCATRGELLNMLYNLEISPEIVAQEYRKSFQNIEYLGDSFPVFYMRSTGVLGAMLGQSYHIDIERGTIWFEEMKGKELTDIYPKLEDDNQLFNRGIELIQAFQNEFHDDIALGIPNLGGMMDIVESMRGATNSLMDLYDDPEEVIRLNNDVFKAFEKAYKENIKAIHNEDILGYTGWITILSQKPYFISQCDFCCMVGKEHFDEFIFDTLKKEANLIERSFYHLDGPGAVKHLDKIIECGFDGIQWINGAGSKPLDDPAWDDIYKKIYQAGLLMQLNIDGVEELKVIDHLVELLGDISHITFSVSGKEKDKERFIEYLDKYGVPH